VHIIRSQNHGYAVSGLRGVTALRLRDQADVRNSFSQQVIMTHAALAEFRISAEASGRDHNRRKPTLEQLIALIQSLSQYR